MDLLGAKAFLCSLFLVLGDSLYSASLTFPEFQRIGSNSYYQRREGDSGHSPVGRLGPRVFLCPPFLFLGNGPRSGMTLPDFLGKSSKNSTALGQDPGSLKNSTALGQDPGSLSRNTYNRHLIHLREKLYSLGFFLKCILHNEQLRVLAASPVSYTLGTLSTTCESQIIKHMMFFLKTFLFCPNH